jgi:hypothetical protein
LLIHSLIAMLASFGVQNRARSQHDLKARD